MLSLRNLARFAPRPLSRMAGTTLRQSAIVRPSTVAKSTTITALRSPVQTSAFSTTVSRGKAAESEVNEELSAKLESEIQIEQDIKTNEQQPASIKDFLDNSPFELIDTPGQEVVKLTRTFGDENITISFSIADITNYDPFSEDNALEDEDLPEDPTNTGKQASSSTANDDQDPDNLEDEFDEEPSAPINLSILIEKPGQTAGALNIDATAHEGSIVVENMFFYEDAKVARIDSPEAAQKRADVYPGPPFGSLDEDLQVLTERFLEERGITDSLAVFVPDYVDVKEQKEYLRWLNNVKTFIDA